MELRRKQIHTVKHTGTGAEARDRVLSAKSWAGPHTTREVEIFEICGGRLAAHRALPAWKRKSSAASPEDDIQHTFRNLRSTSASAGSPAAPTAARTGCAVREAVDSGTISKTRYASYLAMYEEASARKGGKNEQACHYPFAPCRYPPPWAASAPWISL